MTVSDHAVRARVGTSGFSYREWRGSFYPEDLRDREMLSFYARRFDTVEINSTFYRMPTTDRLDDWAARVPEGFSFALKTPRRVTHHKKLRDTSDEMDHLVRTVSELDDKLGPVLVQLPPSLKKDLPLLRDFLSVFPEGFRAAFEFRHASWFADDVFDALAARETALVVADSGNEELPPVTVRTAPYGYARLRREDYQDDDLARWARILTDPGWDDLYVFFKHEEAGTGPRWARRFAEIVGGPEVDD